MADTDTEAARKLADLIWWAREAAGILQGDHHQTHSDKLTALCDLIEQRGLRTPGTVEVCSKCRDKAHDGKFHPAGRPENRAKPCPYTDCPIVCAAKGEG
jgi:hypothetical protein